MLNFTDISAFASEGDDVRDPLDLVVDSSTADTGHGTAAIWVTASDPERQLLARELSGRLETAIATLPARQREVIQLRDVDGWSAAEVCNALGISDTNQRVLLHRARDRVREELRDYLGNADRSGENQPG